MKHGLLKFSLAKTGRFLKAVNAAPSKLAWLIASQDSLNKESLLHLWRCKFFFLGEEPTAQ